jgi:nicotinate-nucleotide adenylyltransferase
LRQRCPRHRFCWLMGADNLHGFRRWQHHDIIAQTVPIAVLDRPGYSYRAISAGRYLLKDRQPVARFRMMALGAHSKPPVWCFIAGRRHHASATALRQAGQDPASQGAFVESHN